METFFSFLYYVIIYFCIGCMITILKYKFHPKTIQKLAKNYVKNCMEDYKQIKIERIQSEEVRKHLENREKFLRAIANTQICLVICILWPISAISLLFADPEGDT